MNRQHLIRVKESRSNERGQAMIEFTLVLLVIVLLTVAVMDLARAIYAWGVISNAARDGAHYAALDSKSPDIITQKATRNRELPGLDNSKIKVEITCDINPDNPYMVGLDDPLSYCWESWNYVHVRVEYKFQPYILLFNPITMVSQSTMVIE